MTNPMAKHLANGPIPNRSTPRFDKGTTLTDGRTDVTDDLQDQVEKSHLGTAPRRVDNPLFHFTCDHGLAAISRSGLLKPTPLTGLLWLTDLDTPYRDALGLTSLTLRCDRTRHRFEVVTPVDVQWWPDVRGEFWPGWVEDLEAAPGAMPRHWFVTRRPQAVAS